MKNILIAFICLLAQNIFSQQIGMVDFDKIKLLTQDSLSETYYPKLIERFVSFDTTLTENDYKLLYYGNIFTENYDPYGRSDAENEFLEIYNKQEYTQAIPLGLKVLEENPINTTVLFKMYVIYYQLSDTENRNNYAMLYYGLLSEIYYSGDGKTCETAMVVIKVSDEYEIISELQLNVKMQSLVGDCDLMEFDTKLQELEKGEKPIKQLYFNVRIPLENLSKQFRSY
ncbi:MAG TPA: DUF4919 domain-containing protein [Bacteroidales bacterium]|nr:DUF4919 domain-containing protein [Bacteroidales bacterium]